MGKKKDGKAKGGAAGDAGHTIPKRIAGVKLPKEVRRKGEALIAAAGSPAGREVIAKGLTLAAGFASMAAKRSRAAEPATGAGAATGQSAEGAPAPGEGGTAALDPAKVVEAVGTVAEAVLGRLFPGTKG